ncbi:MAG TPA: 6-carboxytetrahydropterin synthase [Bacteroidales bacterium]|nr:6-carboxytetrahydropterin synthase [Bacteroidales bacterium]
MSKIRLTKEFKFEMAHALLGYEGPCRHIHGHSYYLYVTVTGSPVSDDHSPINGMVMDFGELKQLVREEIVDQLDHALVLYDKTPETLLQSLKEMNNLVLMPYQPTCENMLEDFAARLQKKLPPNLKLFSLKLCETVTSSAEWYAEDNA